jgi:hypothetical protein
VVSCRSRSHLVGLTISLRHVHSRGSSRGGADSEGSDMYVVMFNSLPVSLFSVIVGCTQLGLSAISIPLYDLHVHSVVIIRHGLCRN